MDDKPAQMDGWLDDRAEFQAMPALAPPQLAPTNKQRLAGCEAARPPPSQVLWTSHYIKDSSPPHPIDERSPGFWLCDDPGTKQTVETLFFVSHHHRFQVPFVLFRYLKRGSEYRLFCCLCYCQRRPSPAFQTVSLPRCVAAREQPAFARHRPPSRKAGHKSRQILPTCVLCLNHHQTHTTTAFPASSPHWEPHLIISSLAAFLLTQDLLASCLICTHPYPPSELF